MNTIAELPDFNKTHKKSRTYKPAPPETIEKYSGILPELLTNTWKEFGFQVFSDGFLWTVSPDEYRDVVADFLHDYQIEDVHVMFRSAFGDMIMSYKEKFYHFSAVTLRHGELKGSLNIILELHLAEKQSLNAIFFFDLFKKAKKLLGEVGEEEVYGLFPALPLGGELMLENLKKTNLRAYLHLLSEASRK